MLADRMEALNDLLMRAEEAHGTFEATELNGVYDQEWAPWYAAWAIEHGIGALLGRDVTSDELAAFLTSSFADFQRIDPGAGGPWSAYTARRLATDMVVKPSA